MKKKKKKSIMKKVNSDFITYTSREFFITTTLEEYSEFVLFIVKRTQNFD